MQYSSVKKESGSVPSVENLPIHYDLYSPVTTQSRSFPVILFLHGFKGFKDWGAFPDACETIARQGFCVVSFNLSKNGVGENMLEFDEPELFRKQTLTSDLEDVGSVIKHLKKGQLKSEQVTMNTDKIGLIGHSRGGHTAVAAAAEFTEVQCLVTWSAVADYNKRWSDEMISDWESQGFTDIVNGRTGQTFPVDKIVYDDARENSDRLMAIKRVKELHIPVLFAAGKDDESVPVKDSKKLFRACPSDDKELLIIENTGHTFGVSHPFEDENLPEPFEDLLESTETWFIQHLR
ncbi:alpha/beta hydrolase [Rhodohalobacter sp. SW132]|uniref:alpha/beta hydrolase family protein n=1 Tax=Rhodohalobacter sp. SW132 TaxID=2293433 RepID=UPI000E261A8C|nr:alpha/beta hydrolase [Rhodohalobacter sp. SW132]REL37617.1 alpha/beta hydrolase [Rhodohalobacter sp. SW132]